jgi:hypothetical protein
LSTRAALASEVGVPDALRRAVCASVGLGKPQEARGVIHAVGDPFLSALEARLHPDLVTELREVVTAIGLAGRKLRFGLSETQGLIVDREAFEVAIESGASTLTLRFLFGVRSIHGVHHALACFGIRRLPKQRAHVVGQYLRPEHAGWFHAGCHWLWRIHNAVTKREREDLISRVGLTITTRVGYALTTIRQRLGRDPLIPWAVFTPRSVKV